MRTSKALSKAWDLKGIPVDKYDDVISAQLSALNERLFSLTAWKLKTPIFVHILFQIL